MMSYEFIQLKARAERAGVGDDPALTKLEHVMQEQTFEAKRHERYYETLKTREKKYAEMVERAIQEAGLTGGTK